MDLRDEMLNMLATTHTEERFSLTGNLLIATSYALINDANIYIWAENELHVFVRLFKSWGMRVVGVVCCAPKNFQTVDDVPIISPEDLSTDTTPKKFFFVDIADGETSASVKFLNEHLQSLQPMATYAVTPEERQSMLGNHPKFDVNSTVYYQSHAAELMELFDSLADENSKRTLYHYVESFVRNCTYRGEQIPTRWKYFFGRKYERLYKHLADECWINCGASVGDTIFAYFSHKFTPKKIFAFDGSTENFNALLKSLQLLPPEKRALVEPINEMIDETTDFEKILAGNRCTLLNADIEGAELNLLHATEKIIRADRPVVAVCVYHFKEDLLTVPKFLQSICDGYRFHLRKYTSWWSLQKQNHEMVFYAVPIERAP